MFVEICVGDDCVFCEEERKKMAASLSPATQRALRTLFHVAVAFATAIPTMLASVPDWAVGAQIVVVATLVSQAVNFLEDAGIIPPWLKGDQPA
jgi:hypothetical protein